MDRITIKTRARENFRKQWGELLLAVVLVEAALAVVSLLTLGVGSVAVTGPLAYALLYMYMKNMNGEKVHQMDLLQGFKKKFGESFLLNLLMSIVYIALVAVAVIVALILDALIMAVGGWNAFAAVGVINVLIVIAAVVFCIIIMLALFMAMYVLLVEEETGAVDALKKSLNLMNGNKGRVFVFMLSFLGWFVLSALTCGILLIWVLPYYYAASIILKKDIYENRAKAPVTAYNQTMDYAYAQEAVIPAAQESDAPEEPEKDGADAPEEPEKNDADTPEEPEKNGADAPEEPEKNDADAQ